ncbi:MAG TPA: hypothetical protein VF131_09320 [Blastocatellia bacterium]|nr:hypothetical protein [Blastocatellia bacterium]
MSEHDTSRDAPAHDKGARKGEEVREADGKEPGRYDKGQSGADRPSGGSTARDSTKINPDAEEPIDPESPNLPVP